MADVLCMGELLIDFVPTEAGVSLIDAIEFKKAPGGAPANVAVGLARLGASSAFMGKVGHDEFGKFLARELSSNGVDISPLVFSDVARTALAFVSLTSEGERDFMFYRHPSADMLFEPFDVNRDDIKNAKIFHFGSISLISEPSRSATLHAIDLANQHNLLISYDPNLRQPLWPDETAARKGMLIGWERAYLIKASHEEIVFLTGETGIVKGVRQLWHPDLKLVVVTQGSQGAWYFTKRSQGHIPGLQVNTIDTTGAGDGFVAGLLAKTLEHPALWDDEAALGKAVQFANAVGALTTTILGAIPALPDKEAVQDLLAGQQ